MIYTIVEDAFGTITITMMVVVPVMCECINMMAPHGQDIDGDAAGDNSGYSVHNTVLKLTNRKLIPPFNIK